MNIGSVGFGGSIVGGATGIDGSSGVDGTSTIGGCGSGTNTGVSICGFVSGVASFAVLY